MGSTQAFRHHMKNGHTWSEAKKAKFPVDLHLRDYWRRYLKDQQQNATLFPAPQRDLELEVQKHPEILEEFRIVKIKIGAYNREQAKRSRAKTRICKEIRKQVERQNAVVAKDELNYGEDMVNQDVAEGNALNEALGSNPFADLRYDQRDSLLNDGNYFAQGDLYQCNLVGK